MQFSIKTSPQYTTWEDMLAVWQTADDIEVFTGAWNFDHFYPINVPDTTGPCMEAWVTLTALAQATTRLRIGTMVNGIVYRHPAVLAKMASTLDIVSNGRLELGIGAGWNEEECNAYGIELGSLTERFDRFEEACAVLQGLLTQETTSFDGNYFNLTEARNNPKPLQKPHPPICIGGQGPKRTLPLVARYAQHWNFMGQGTAKFLERKSQLDAECAQIGRDPSEIWISTSVWVGTDLAPGEVAQLAAKQFDNGVNEVLLYLPPPHDPNVLEPLAHAIAEIRS